MKASVISLIGSLICASAFGQVEFFDNTAQLLGDEKRYSTICIGFDDFNGDLKDDLFILDEGKVLKTFIQGAPNQAFTYREHLQVSANGDWSFISGDLDNDAIPEIICSGLEDGSQFLKYDGSDYNTSFTVATSNYAQNSNLVDLNDDGFLDFFVCNDDGENFIFLNNGSGGMIETKPIDFQTSEEDDMSGNYSSIFTDIDGDDDLDLYIGKCRGGVNDPTDRRRINTLYINNGDGTYTESAEAFGLNTGAQSWSVDAGDVDNDGDIDIFIANHDRAHDLMINDGNGHFDRKTLVSGGYTSFAYQSFFCDFDNNGWLDIFVTDPSFTYILYNDEMSFTKRDLLGNSRKAFSGATGDLNSDGFPDLYLGFGNSFQSPSDIADKVLMNRGNTNNYLDVNLEGTVSNRDAIGAKITLYQEGKIQSREIHAGKSYGIMNSTIAHFGLGKTTVVDSVKIKWTSGLVTVIDEISEVNTLLSVREDGCYSTTYVMPDLQLCGGDSIEVILPLEFNNFRWSNGSTEASIWIDAPGWYSVEFEDLGCVIRSSYFEVTEEKTLEEDDILSQVEIVACDGEVVELEAYSGTAYYWSTEETSQVIEVSESGIYNVAMATNCDEYTSGDVDVFFGAIKIPIIENDSVLLGESATFIGESEDLNWYLNKNDLEPLATGSEFVTTELFEDQTFYVSEITEGFGFNRSLMKTVPLNNIGDSTYTQNDFIEFEVLEELTLYSVKARTQKAGVRRIVVLEDDEELVAFDANLLVGVNTINIDYILKPGIYRIGTDSVTNQNNLSTEHPQLSYSQNYVQNDKRINGFLEIAESELYPGITPYFFDWEIYYGHYYCDPRVAVHALIKEPVSTEDLIVNSVVFPNPTAGKISVRTDMEIPYSIDVLNVSGTKVMGSINGDQPVMTFEMPKISGLYFLKLTNGFTSEVKKVYVH